MAPRMKARSRKSAGLSGTTITRAILRGSMGGIMIAHGVRHGRTLDGTTRWFESIGFSEPRLQAQLSSVVEVGSGTAVLAGAATPLSTSAIVGTMAVAFRTIHQPNGFFVVSEGWEYVGFMGAAALALSALGPGRLSVDGMLGLDDIGTPTKRALVTAGIGIGGAIAQILSFWTKPEPNQVASN